MTTTSTDPQRVAVYGTLRRDLGPAWGMEVGTPVGLGTTPGALYTHAAFPAVVPDEPGEVTVQVIDYTDVERDRWRRELAIMDRIEGVPRHYHRELAEITMEDGTVLDAWIYYLSRHPTEAGMVPVPNGDWAEVRGGSHG